MCISDYNECVGARVCKRKMNERMLSELSELKKMRKTSFLMVNVA